MGNIFWIIIVVGLLCLLQVRYYSSVGFKKLSYRRAISRKSVFEGDKLEMIETLVNKKLTPLPWVRVESKISKWLRFKNTENLDIADERFHKSVFFMNGYSKITRRHEVRCLRRGYYDLSNTSVTIGDMFGMNSIGKEYTGDAKLFVYPRLLDSDALSNDALKWQGDVAVKRWILPDPMLVNGIREYQSGDNMRDIHWKASARTGELQVKTHDYTCSPRVMIVLNCEPEDNFWGYLTEEQAESLEGSLRIVATFAHWAVHSGIDVGFYTNGMNALNPKEPIGLNANCSESHLESIFQILAALVIKQNETIHQTLDRMMEDRVSNCDIMVLSTFWNEQLEKRADHLRSNTNTVTHIPIRREVIDFEVQ
ncbi:MAG: DUF58 domain-containing protein [Ruminococcaceae bacterium]|nr:DUF58 domain-containing protein [Oscillospiraceae bacterium]